MRITPVFVFAGALLAASVSSAQSPDQVLLVVNSSSTASVAVGEAYVAARHIPAGNVVKLAMPVADEIERTDYGRLIEVPLSKAIAAAQLQDRIDYIVLTKDIPLRIKGTTGRLGTMGSVDSELALLYRKMTGAPAAPGGRIDNPYFLGAKDLSAAKPFSHADHDIYLVTRLDAFTVEEATALITRAADARDTGSIVLDMKAGIDDIGNRWLDEAATKLTAMGYAERVTVERTSDVVKDVGNVLGYFSWGSSDPSVKMRKLGLGFVPGSLAASFVSTDARTMTAPPDTWTVGDWNNRQQFYAGSPQSLVGDLIAQGATGVAGNVAEPLLDGVVRPQILFPAWLSGFTLGEAFYLAMPFVGWQGVVIGDPLAVLVPGKRPAAPPAPSLDSTAELPAWFTARRLASLNPSEADKPGARAFLRAESRQARDDKAGAKEALEEAVKLAPRSTVAQHQLAATYERDQEFDKAIALYQALLALNPRDVVALNNLAYALAEHKQRPGDALPYAERAYGLNPRDGSIIDTLAWTYHLLGRFGDAMKYSTMALQLQPTNPEVVLNRVAILLANGDKANAKAALEYALKLDPSLAERDRVRKLQAGM